MAARHSTRRRPARVILVRAALVLWITFCGLVVLLFGIAGLVAIFDPATSDGGPQLGGSVLLVCFALLLAAPAVRRLRGPVFRRSWPRRPAPRGRTVVHGKPPVPYRQLRSRHLLAQYQRMSAVDNATGPALARLTDAERALGVALYQLDLRRAELGVPRELVAGARAAALTTAAALRRWTVDAPLTTTRGAVARPVDRGALAIKRLTSAVDAVLTGAGTPDQVRAATGAVADATV